MNSSLTQQVFNNTLKYLEEMPKSQRKAIGQFFTSVETATYMANMFGVPQTDTISILDPGSGSGILSAAIIERLQEYPNLKQINLTCYENNEDVLPLLKQTLLFLAQNSKIPLCFRLVEDNYITSQEESYNNPLLNIDNIEYDIIIGNPPYKKIPKDAKEALAMPNICYGAPNLYFLFMGMSLFNLKPNGELVYIIPRSWTSGAYFKKFRDYLFDVSTLKQVHLFVSRDKVFEKEEVLQETIIVKFKKNSIKEDVIVTCSKSNSDFDNITTFTAPYTTIVSGSENYVYLITNKEELNVLSTLSKFKNTLPSINLKMRTGLTVDFRSYDYLRNDPVEGTVPLFYSQHIKNGRVVFPIEKDYQYVVVDKPGLVQRNKNYLLVKRFTAKEERRRFQCGIYLSSDLPEYTEVSTQNKLNFIEGIGFDISDEQTYGLYVLFNSTIYDKYYRILNGSTQVNSTEVNTIPVPTLIEIEMLGVKLLKEDNLSTEVCDKILGELIYG